MKEKIKNISETLKELLMGIVFYGIIVEVLILCFSKKIIYLSI